MTREPCVRRAPTLIAGTVIMSNPRGGMAKACGPTNRCLQR